MKSRHCGPPDDSDGAIDKAQSPSDQLVKLVSFSLENVFPFIKSRISISI